MTVDARESKLPKWAREELFMLRRRLSEARQERDHLLAGPPSNTGVIRYGALEAEGGPAVRWLEDHAVVRFFLDSNHADPWTSRSGIEVQVERGGPGVRVSAWGAPLRVVPRAANVIRVDDRGEP